MTHFDGKVNASWAFSIAQLIVDYVTKPYSKQMEDERCRDRDRLIPVVARVITPQDNGLNGARIAVQSTAYDFAQS